MKIQQDDTDKGRLADSAAERSRLYSFLARMFGSEPAAVFLDELEQLEAVLAASGVSFDDNVLGRPRAEAVEMLAVEYAHLFLGPGPHIAPYASIHSPRGAGLLLGVPATRIEAFIEESGYEFSPDYRGMPDHVSVVLEFMAWMAASEAEAWAAGDVDDAAAALRREWLFLDEHLLPWIPVFCERVVEAAELSFYREMAALTADYLRFDADEVARTLGLMGYDVADLRPRPKRRRSPEGIAERPA